MFVHTTLMLLSIGLVKTTPASTKPLEYVEPFKITNYTGSFDGNELEVDLTKIGSLDIFSSKLTKLTKDSLRQLVNLENLTISHSEFERIDDDLFTSCCPKLKRLEINSLKGLKEGDIVEIGNLPLEALELINQNIPVLKSGTFEKSNLKSISLVKCNIEKIEDGAFRGLDKLEYLLISKNTLKSIPKMSLVPLKNLETLKFESNGIEKISVDDFPQLPSLTDLVLIRESLKEVDLKGIHKVAPKLADVYLIKNKILITAESEGSPKIHTEY